MLRRLLLASLVVFAALSLCRAPPLVLGTFNIRWFPHANTDREAVAVAIAGLDADAFAVQEILDPIAFQDVLDRASALSGRRYQMTLAPARCPPLKVTVHLGVVHDAGEFDVLESRPLGEYTCPEGQPVGMLALLRAHDGRRLALASVHMPAGDGAEVRRLREGQWNWLARALPGLRAELAAPVVVAGDFNSTGYLVKEDPERRFIDEVLGRGALQMPTERLGCSMYWNPRSGEYAASLLDHVVASDELEFGAAEALGMCAELACAPQTRAPAGWTDVSDHCPVRVALRL